MAAGEAQPSSAEEAEVWEGAEGDKQSNTDAEREHELSNTDWKQGGKIINYIFILFQLLTINQILKFPPSSLLIF